jgi:hypothetical protein
MINPSRVHRAKAVVTKLPRHENDTTEVICNGHKLEGWPKLPKGLVIGDTVNIQSNFSIMLDRYTINTIRKIRKHYAVC